MKKALNYLIILNLLVFASCKNHSGSNILPKNEPTNINTEEAFEDETKFIPIHPASEQPDIDLRTTNMYFKLLEITNDIEALFIPHQNFYNMITPLSHLHINEMTTGIQVTDLRCGQTYFINQQFRSKTLENHEQVTNRFRITIYSIRGEVVDYYSDLNEFGYINLNFNLLCLGNENEYRIKITRILENGYRATIQDQHYVRDSYDSFYPINSYR